MNKPVIFADFHHSGLMYSLKLLFEDRLGGTLLRPVGLEWWENGYWDIAKPYNDSIDTISQYLKIDSSYKPVDKTVPLNKIKDKKSLYYEIEELAHGYTQKAITWDQFLNLDIDIIVASIPDHWETYSKLKAIYKPQAKLICQAGNAFNELEDYIKDGTVKNLMSATAEFDVPSFINAVFYHEEQPVVEYKEPPVTPSIKSFVHLLPRHDLYDIYKEALKPVEMKAYGALCPNGSLATLTDVYAKMQSASMILHIKPMGDGYGWVWHSAFMLGRPIITNFSDYKDKLGGKLFEHGVTGIDLERGTNKENITLIKDILADRERLKSMCEEARRRFFQVVDYERELKNIKTFLNCLL